MSSSFYLIQEIAENPNIFFKSTLSISLQTNDICSFLFYFPTDTKNLVFPTLILSWSLTFISGKFDSAGIAIGVPDESIGKVKALRLNVHNESDNWAILSEVSIEVFFHLCRSFIHRAQYRNKKLDKYRVFNTILNHNDK